jgi:hypothetical protein
VEPLIAALKDKDNDVRKAAAEALIILYRSGRLKDRQKRSVLAKPDTITRPHRDVTKHAEQASCVTGTRESSYIHTDSGIGVYFPLLF